jgi:NADH-quinone oxidoreductase subunit L
VITAGLTAFYMTRLYLLVFAGESRADAKTVAQVHESPPSMTVPLIILAAGALLAGFIGVPHFLGGSMIPNHLEHYLEPVFGAHATLAVAGGAHGAASQPLLSEWTAMVITLLAAAAGIVMAWNLYGRREAGAAERPAGGVLRLVRGKFFVDEMIEAVVLRPYRALCRGSSSFDSRVVDGLVNAVGIGTDLMGEVTRLVQTGYVRNYALAFFLGTVVILLVVLR